MIILRENLINYLQMALEESQNIDLIYLERFQTSIRTEALKELLAAIKAGQQLEIIG